MPRDQPAVGAGGPTEWLALGRANARIGDWDKVAANFAEALELLPYDASDPDASAVWKERAGVCLELAKYDEAFTTAIGLRPTDGQLWLGRARRHAREGLWVKAATDFAEAIRMLPDDHWAWYEYGFLHFQVGDQEGYRQAYRSALQRFKTTRSGSVAHRVALIALLTPLATDDLKLSMEMAEQGVREQPANGWHLFTLALAQHRAGESMEAKKSLLKASVANGYRGVEAARVPIDLLSAMTYHRLGENEEARRHLGKAKEEMDHKLPSRGGADLGEDWHNRVLCQQLLREAEDLVKGPAPAGEQIATKSASTTKQGTEVAVARAGATGHESRTTPTGPSPATSATAGEGKDGSIAPAANQVVSLGGQVQRAITVGVRYLKEHQRQDGSWPDIELEARTGMTSLVALALMTAGETVDSQSARVSPPFWAGRAAQHVCHLVSDHGLRNGRARARSTAHRGQR